MEYIIADFKKSLKAWRFWLLFGYHDAQGPMRRTRFGLLFYTVQPLLRTCIIFFVLGSHLTDNTNEYFGYVAIGLPLFAFYTSAVTSGYGMLTKNKAMIENGKIPFIACIFRFFIDHSVRFLFAILVYVGFVIFNPSTLNLATFLVVPGLVIAIIFIFAVALTFMIVSAFFPDVSEAIHTVMTTMFFATPIFWYPGAQGEVRNMIASVNPFTHLIAVVREPALGHVPEMLSYIYACWLTLVLIGVSAWLFSTARHWMIFKL